MYRLSIATKNTRIKGPRNENECSKVGSKTRAVKRNQGYVAGSSRGTATGMARRGGRQSRCGIGGLLGEAIGGKEGRERQSTGARPPGTREKGQNQQEAGGGQTADR
ncbi:hypothetical protein CDL15_Pgr024720 [Punica granatum]|uniref:Uncharacterized protein n=1 Tax=Punica granatum TaxID=22663 RepID=A0A218W4D3_PUNGR|nr:hypothetical protein CDL15_Pgr024720 [Punica granatum]